MFSELYQRNSRIQMYVRRNF